MQNVFKNYPFLLGGQMYNLKPTRKNFSFNNLFTPIPTSLSNVLSKSGREDTYSHIQSQTTLKAWKFGRMEV
jgi:hypothetical protein